MATDKQHGKLIFICDGCGDICETGERDFDEALATMKTEGWVSAKDGEVWKHFCGECKRDTRLRVA